MRILITGFEPFGGSEVNSSWEVASRVGIQPVEGHEILCRQLPVSFRRVGEQIEELLMEVRPDIAIMLGQKGSGNSIDIERVALNMMDSAKEDNDGYMPDESLIHPDGPPAYFSHLPVKVLRDCLIENGISAKVSNSAGLYVCNCAYYEAINAVCGNGLKTRVAFVHIPRISEDWTIEKLQLAVTLLIEHC